MFFQSKEPVDPIVAHFRKCSTFEVAKWVAAEKGTFRQVAAEQELARRQFLRTFLTHGIVSWIALLISLLSLLRK